MRPMARPAWWTYAYDVLTPRQARAIRQTVHALYAHWVVRHPRAPFYTLGRAAYLDASGGRGPRYLEQAAEANPALKQHFGTLLEDVRCILEAHLLEPVAYAPGLALPGFHVFQAHPLAQAGTARIHFDLQHTELGLTEIPTRHTDGVLSFTLPVALPRAGGALDVWDLHRMDVPLSARSDLSRLAATRRHWQEHYRVGTLVLHSGNWAHRIAPTLRIRARDERITLQGHAVRTEHGWLAYW
jgi:hypothetical protein